MAIGDYIKYKTGLSQRARRRTRHEPQCYSAAILGCWSDGCRNPRQDSDRFGLDLLDLMVESGLITTARAKSLRVGGSIRDVSNEDLMGEVLRRMTAAQTREQSVRATVPPTTPVEVPAAAYAQAGRAVTGAASGASGEGERKYTAEDYALAAKRGEIYDSEEGFFGA